MLDSFCGLLGLGGTHVRVALWDQLCISQMELALTEITGGEKSGNENSGGAYVEAATSLPWKGDYRTS